MAKSNVSIKPVITKELEGFFLLQINATVAKIPIPEALSMGMSILQNCKTLEQDIGLLKFLTNEPAMQMTIGQAIAFLQNMKKSMQPQESKIVLPERGLIT